MNFQETLDYLYNSLPMFQRIGNAAYIKDLANTLAFCERLGNPQNKFKSIHIAGTNGKGSSSHMIAAVLQCAGYKVGLYTSPHLKNFTERIRINGKEIDERYVVEFVEQHKNFIEKIHPSFFEMTVAMAFDHFARQQVDFAVIEVGMGGRLDSTNVITPEISLITNISYDHQAILGNTLAEIASEKAGIIKANVPVVISEYQSEISHVFEEKANELSSKICFASQEIQVELLERNSQSIKVKAWSKNGWHDNYELDLTGNYQLLNLPGVIKTLQALSEKYAIAEGAIQEGLMAVKTLTGLKGRWQILHNSPMIICDTGHNESGIRFVCQQLSLLNYKNLWIIIGMVNDKPPEKVLNILPKEAYYYFCEANIPRALDAQILHDKSKEYGLRGEKEKDVNQALLKALQKADKDDVIFIGGSNFVVAEIENL